MRKHTPLYITIATLFFSAIWLITLTFISPNQARAQEQTSDERKYYKGVVTEIVEERKTMQEDRKFVEQLVKVQLENNQVQTVSSSAETSSDQPTSQFKKGDRVVVVSQRDSAGNLTFAIVDYYRVPYLLSFTLAFLLLVVGIAKKQGAFSILGMGLSFVVLLQFIIPQILAGKNPLLIVLIGSAVISAITIYLSHGFTSKSHIALFSILGTLGIVLTISALFLKFSNLSGMGSEEAKFLLFGSTAYLNMKGLLLGGIVLGALSVLDDIAVSQVSIVYQLLSLKENLGFSELFSRAMTVGKDHISSLVNTLVLAYAGASLPLFMLFTTSSTQPVWVSLNDQMIAEEIVRTVAGSIGLVLCVPITTFFAALVARRQSASTFYQSTNKKELHANH